MTLHENILHYFYFFLDYQIKEATSLIFTNVCIVNATGLLS